MAELEKSNDKINEKTAEKPRETNYKILILEERLAEQGIDWEMLNWHAKNGKFSENLPSSEEYKERKKMTFPDNLQEYNGLAEVCIDAIDGAYKNYLNEKYGNKFKRLLIELCPLISPPSKLEILKRVTFAVKIATASYTDSKMIFGTRY